MIPFIKRACSISDKIFLNLIKELKKGSFNTELDIDRFLKQQCKSFDVRPSFPPIVANNNGEIHPVPRNKKLQRGFLIVDFGVKYRGYCSDCTRTFFIGKPAKKDKELYDLVLLAQETALLYANPGVFAADLDLIARAVLQDYLLNFRHALGHGVGKRIHQSPRVSPNSKSILKKDQVITVEPGLYFKDKGLRIEDTVVVKNRPLVLTKVSKKLIII